MEDNNNSKESSSDHAIDISNLQYPINSNIKFYNLFIL